MYDNKPGQIVFLPIILPIRSEQFCFQMQVKLITIQQLFGVMRDG